jgi:Small Multidrug Resistance protein
MVVDGFFISISLSFYLLNKAIQAIPLGKGYAAWTGIGAVGTAIVGIFIFHEPAFFGGSLLSPCLSVRSSFKVRLELAHAGRLRILPLN